MRARTSKKKRVEPTRKKVDLLKLLKHDEVRIPVTELRPGDVVRAYRRTTVTIFNWWSPTYKPWWTVTQVTDDGDRFQVRGITSSWGGEQLMFDERTLECKVRRPRGAGGPTYSYAAGKGWVAK